jgi:hypothetical protein
MSDVDHSTTLAQTMEPLLPGLVTNVKYKTRLEGLDAARLSSTTRGGNGGPDGFKNKDGQGLQ